MIFSPKIIGDLNEIILMKVGEFQFPLKVFGKGKFGTEQLDSSKAEEIKVEDLNPSFL